MRIPNWLLWLLLAIGLANAVRLPFIDSQGDSAYMAGVIVGTGITVALGIAAGWTLYKRGEFRLPDTDANPDDD